MYVYTRCLYAVKFFLLFLKPKPRPSSYLNTINKTKENVNIMEC